MKTKYQTWRGLDRDSPSITRLPENESKSGASPRIAAVTGREVLDARGNPTVEADVVLDDGSLGRAIAPAGVSKGSREALELRDEDAGRYGGRGVRKAVANIDGPIADLLAGFEAARQTQIDAALISLDGTANKGKLGANAILAVSLAAAKAAANSLGTPLYRYLGGAGARILPVPIFNIVNCGRHSDAPVAFQAFMIRPAGATSFSEALRMGCEVFHSLGEILERRGLGGSVGDAGGFAPAFKGAEDAIETILLAIGRSGLKAGRKSVGGHISLALDCAASEFYVANPTARRETGVYDYSLFEGVGARVRTSSGQVAYLKRLCDSYPIDSIEDGMHEDDWEGWRELTRELGERCQLVGDDIFTTNVRFLRRGVAEGVGNAVLVKPNQVGTLTEALEVIGAARRAGYGAVVSTRSAETEDTAIADLAVAMNTGHLKAGGLSRSERVAKYNRLLRIEKELGGRAVFGA